MEVISLPQTASETRRTMPGGRQVEDALHAQLPRLRLRPSSSVDIVGPTAGKQLQQQARLATIYSLIGMLIYLWFRFELIYGVAAVVAVFHDTLITVGAFSLTNQEITLTVIAAILTLIGYSMNDTIVVFDRIRENLALIAPRGADGRGQSQHQPDAEPDSDLLWPDLPYRAEPVVFGGAGAARLLVRADGRHPHRNLFVDRGGRAHAGGVPGLAQEPAARWPACRPSGPGCNRRISRTGLRGADSVAAFLPRVFV